MNFLSLLGGGFTKTVSNLVDNLHTSEEEKLEAKLEMLKLIQSTSTAWKRYKQIEILRK